MSERKKKAKSGSQKRKEKKLAQLQESASSSRNVRSYFAKTPVLSSSTTTSVSASLETQESVEATTEREESIIEDEDSDVVPIEEQDSPPRKVARDDIVVELLGSNEHHTATMAAEKLVSKESAPEPPSFLRPSSSQLVSFLKQHPCQPTEGISFNHVIAYNRMSLQGDQIPRKWVSYSQKHDSLYCFICLAFCKTVEVPFSVSVLDRKHLYTRLKEHECSQMHSSAVEAYMVYNSKSGSIQRLFQGPAAEKHRQQVEQRRTILVRIIEVIKTLGKQGVAFRGRRNESAHSLRDDGVNHGNFLEIIKLVAMFDSSLQDHLRKVSERSNALKVNSSTANTGKIGRGSFVTFLSKSTVNSLLQVLRNMIQERIAEEVKKAKIYSVQMDTTQDISGQDQCSIVVRYADKGSVHERLLSVVKASGTSGLELFNLLKTTLEHLKIDIVNCVGDSFDGAANMLGKYQGVQAKISEVASKHIHVWCYAHTLNLVLGDATSLNVSCISLFGLLNKCATFFRESFKRMEEWEKSMLSKFGAAKLRRLNTIGTTRWWAKSGAIRKIFGSFYDEDAAEKGLFVDLVMTLSIICKEVKFNSETRDQANNLLNKLLLFETIATAFVFNRIFSITAPLSEYLQARNLDMLQAWRMVETDTESLVNISRDFKEVHLKAIKFAEGANAILQERAGEDDIILKVATTFPEKRTSSNVLCPVKKYEVEVHNTIMDQVISSMKRRFLQHGNLYKDFSCLDPRRFVDFKKKGIPQESLKKLCEVSGYTADCEVIKEQLRNFSEAFPRLAMTLPEEYQRNVQENCDSDDDSPDFVDNVGGGNNNGSGPARNDSDNDDDDDAEVDDADTGGSGSGNEDDVSMGQDGNNDDNGGGDDGNGSGNNGNSLLSKGDNDDEVDMNGSGRKEKVRENISHGSSCRSCFACVFKVLYEFGLNSTAYSELYCIYKFMMTLAVTQVECERSFSFLKIIKSRLRSIMGQERLEALMLISIERHLLQSISNEDVIEEYSKTSKELHRLLH